MFHGLETSASAVWRRKAKNVILCQLVVRSAACQRSDLKPVGVISGRCNIASSLVGVDRVDLRLRARSPPMGVDACRSRVSQRARHHPACQPRGRADEIEHVDAPTGFDGCEHGALGGAVALDGKRQLFAHCRLDGRKAHGLAVLLHRDQPVGFLQRLLRRVPVKLDHFLRRHARACRGHPRLSCDRPASKAWMAGTSPAMTPAKWFKMSGTRNRVRSQHGAIKKNRVVLSSH